MKEIEEIEKRREKCKIGYVCVDVEHVVPIHGVAFGNLPKHHPLPTLILAFFAGICLLSSCKTSKPVVIEREHTQHLKFASLDSLTFAGWSSSSSSIDWSKLGRWTITEYDASRWDTLRNSETGAIELKHPITRTIEIETEEQQHTDTDTATETHLQSTQVVSMDDYSTDSEKIEQSAKTLAVTEYRRIVGYLLAFVVFFFLLRLLAMFRK